MGDGMRLSIQLQHARRRYARRRYETGGGVVRYWNMRVVVMSRGSWRFLRAAGGGGGGGGDGGADAAEPGACS